MKYTIEGLNQEYLCELGLDANDAIILRWIIDFWHTQKMKKFIIDNQEYLWINYQSIIDNLPILKINNKIALAKRMKKICDIGLLIHKCHKIGGTYSCYRFTEKYDRLTEKYNPLSPETYNPVSLKSENKDSSIIDSSIKKIQSAYPPKCLLRNKNTNRSNFKKDKLIKLIKEKGTDYLLKAMSLYLDDCKKSQTYIKNFATFINNYPKVEDYQIDKKIMPDQIKYDLANKPNEPHRYIGIDGEEHFD